MEKNDADMKKMQFSQNFFCLRGKLVKICQELDKEQKKNRF